MLLEPWPMIKNVFKVMLHVYLTRAFSPLFLFFYLFPFEEVLLFCIHNISFLVWYVTFIFVLIIDTQSIQVMESISI